MEYKSTDAQQSPSDDGITNVLGSSENQENSDKSTSDDKEIQSELKRYDSSDVESKLTENNIPTSKNSVNNLFAERDCENKTDLEYKHTESERAMKGNLSVSVNPSETDTYLGGTNDKEDGYSYPEKHPCDFCGISAQFVCSCCTYTYCKSCRDKLHPPVGPFQHHDIAPIDDEMAVTHFDQCSEHGLPEKLFCDFCKGMKCIECARSKCKLHFKGRISDVDIETEQKQLLKEYEKASSKFYFLGKYRQNLEEEALNIELNTLLKRDKIRQEFASFHEMLIMKEHAILEKLDKDMQTRLRYIEETLLARIEKLEKEENRLTNIVMDLIQSQDNQHFIEEHVIAKERCRDVDGLIHDFDEFWARHSSYTPSFLLDNHLSMLCEKRQLSDRLDVALGHGAMLRFRQATLHISHRQELDLFKYLQIPSSTPPSTEREFLVQVYNGGVIQYSTMVSDPSRFRLGSDASYLFTKGASYLIQVAAYHKPFGVESRCKQSGMPTHMLLLCISLKKKQHNYEKPQIKRSVRKIRR